MIVAPKDHVLISVDYSQAETWIVAHKAGDVKMIKSLKYGDIHVETAANVIVFPNVQCYHRDWTELDFPWKKLPDKSFRCDRCGNIITDDNRYLGKRTNHATSYQMEYARYTEIVNKDADKPPYITISLNEGRFYNQGWKNYYKLQPWWDWIPEQLREHNRELKNAYGRRMIFNDEWGHQLFKSATAWEPQSTVGDHANGLIHPELGIRGGFVEVDRQLVDKDKCGKIINQSHDSIVFECPRTIAKEVGERIIKICRRPLVIKDINGKEQEFTIPMDIEIGERWGELEKVKVA